MVGAAGDLPPAQQAQPTPNCAHPTYRENTSSLAARRKAYTAMTFKMTTEEFAKLMETNPVRRQQATLPGVIGIPGGVPLKAGNDVVGGVGLSGSPGVDEPCVMAGINKVTDQLK